MLYILRSSMRCYLIQRCHPSESSPQRCILGLYAILGARALSCGQSSIVCIATFAPSPPDQSIFFADNEDPHLFRFRASPKGVATSVVRGRKCGGNSSKFKLLHHDRSDVKLDEAVTSETWHHLGDCLAHTFDLEIEGQRFGLRYMVALC